MDCVWTAYGLFFIIADIFQHIKYMIIKSENLISNSKYFVPKVFCFMSWYLEDDFILSKQSFDILVLYWKY